jgi:dUTP pyrophosphatase
MNSKIPIPLAIQTLHPLAQVPNYAHLGDAGADLFAVEATTIAPGQWQAIATGLAAEIPIGYELQVRPKSGIALKYGVTVLNSPGTVDAGYRGEIKVILINHSSEPFTIQPQQKIAQIILAKVEQASFQVVATLGSSDRGEGGFGSTGLV